ncbi:MAG: hypothetical protein SOV40_08155 [Prevotella sp.]|nr:hypothetical protein [Bacteroidales bacterium]MDY2693595.1 hypothetical protein [Prevotella sp.]
MGFQYTKKKEEDEQRERTVQAEEFANLMTKFNKQTEQIKELPKKESLY